MEQHQVIPIDLLIARSTQIGTTPLLVISDTQSMSSKRKFAECMNKNQQAKL